MAPSQGVLTSFAAPFFHLHRRPDSLSERRPGRLRDGLHRRPDRGRFHHCARCGHPSITPALDGRGRPFPLLRTARRNLRDHRDSEWIRAVPSRPAKRDEKPPVGSAGGLAAGCPGRPATRSPALPSRWAGFSAPHLIHWPVYIHQDRSQKTTFGFVRAVLVSTTAASIATPRRTPQWISPKTAGLA